MGNAHICKSGDSSNKAAIPCSYDRNTRETAKIRGFPRNQRFVLKFAHFGQECYRPILLVVTPYVVLFNVQLSDLLQILSALSAHPIEIPNTSTIHNNIQSIDQPD